MFILFPNEYLYFVIDVCYCLQKVGCDRVLGSKKKEDNCGVCDGRNYNCRTMTGTLGHKGLLIPYFIIPDCVRGGQKSSLAKVANYNCNWSHWILTSQANEEKNDISKISYWIIKMVIFYMVLMKFSTFLKQYYLRTLQCS